MVVWLGTALGARPVAAIGSKLPPPPPIPGWFSGGPKDDPLQTQLEGRLRDFLAHYEDYAARGCPTGPYWAADKLDTLLRQSSQVMYDQWANMGQSDLTNMGLLATRTLQVAGAVGGIVAAAPAAFGILGTAGESVAAVTLASTITYLANELNNILTSAYSGSIDRIDQALNGANLALGTANSLQSQLAAAGLVASDKIAQLGQFLATIKAAFDLSGDLLQAFKDNGANAKAYLDAATNYQSLLGRLKDAVTAMQTAVRSCPPATPSPSECVPDVNHPCGDAGGDQTIVERYRVRLPSHIPLTFAYCDGLICGTPENADCVSNLWIPQFDDTTLPPEAVIAPPGPGLVPSRVFTTAGNGGPASQYGYFDSHHQRSWNPAILANAPAVDAGGNLHVSVQGSQMSANPILAKHVVNGMQCGITTDEYHQFQAQYGSGIDNTFTDITITVVWAATSGHAKGPATATGTAILGGF